MKTQTCKIVFAVTLNGEQDIDAIKIEVPESIYRAVPALTYQGGVYYVGKVDAITGLRMFEDALKGYIDD